MSTEDQNIQGSTGLGDDIAKITAKLGIDKTAEQIAKAMGKKDCGCKRRQQKLNQMFPYKNTENTDGSQSS